MRSRARVGLTGDDANLIGQVESSRLDVPLSEESSPTARVDADFCSWQDAMSLCIDPFNETTAGRYAWLHSDVTSMSFVAGNRTRSP